MRNKLLFLLKIILENSVLKMLILTSIFYLLTFKIEISLIISVIILCYFDFEYNIENFSSDDKNVVSNLNTTISDTTNQKTSLDTTVKTADKTVDKTVTDTKTSDTQNSTNTQNSNIQSMNVLSAQNILNINSDDSTTQNKTNNPASSPSALLSNGIIINKTSQNVGISAINSLMGLSNNVEKDEEYDTNPKEFVIKDDKSNKKESKLECTPVVPNLLFTESTNKGYIVRISINSAILKSSGKCIINDHPLEYNLRLGIYKVINKDENYEIPEDIIKINDEKKNEKKDIHLFVRKGYKVTFISKSGNKSFTGLATSNDTPFVNSSEIKKGLLKISEIRVEKSYK